MPNRTLTLRTLLVAVAAATVTSCADGADPVDPTTPPAPAAARITLVVEANGFDTQDPVAPNSFDLRVIASNGTVLRELSGAFSEDPNRTFGPYDVAVGSEPSTGIAVELLVSRKGEGSSIVVWSGRLSGVSLTPGEATQVSISLFRGSLDQAGLSGVSIEGLPAEVAVGDEFALTVSTDGGSASTAAGWGSLDPDILTVDAQGRAQALAEGPARIVVALGPVADTAFTLVRPLVERIEIDPSHLDFVSLNETLQLDARVISFRGDTLPDESVSWTIDPLAVATVTSTGLVRSVGPGSALVTASAGGVSATATVQVAQVPARIVLTPHEVELTPFEFIRFSARVEDARGFAIRDAEPDWSSSDSTIVQVDAQGLARALALGSARVEATAGGAVGSADISVVAGEVAALQLLGGGGQTAQVNGELPERIRVRAVDALGFPVAGLPIDWLASDGGNVDVNPSVTDHDGTTSVRWTLGSAPGTQTLSATAGGAMLDVTAEAESPDPAAITISPEGASFASIGEARLFVAEVRDGADNVLPDASVSWATVNEGIASVDATGLVTAVSPGATQLVATAGAVADTVALLVSQVADSVAVTPVTDSIEPGETTALSAVVFDAEGVVIVGAPVTWSSLAPTIAGVDGSGVVTGESEGDAQVEATSGAAVGAATITVVPATAASLEIASGNAQAGPAGLTLADSLEVRVLSAFGRTVAGVDVSWVAASGGTAAPSPSTSGADGIARTAWTLGAGTGAQTLEASVPSIPAVSFDAEATGASRVFDRTAATDQIVVASDPSGDLVFPDSDWTLGMWVRPDDTSSGFQYAFSGAESPFAQGVNIYLNPDLGMNWTISVRNATSGGVLPGGGPSTEGVWQYLVVRKSGTVVRLWVDGTEITTHSLTVDGAITPSVSPRFGVRGDGTPEWFSGGIAHVARWSSALSPAEIVLLAGGTHALDVASGTRDWFLPMGRDPEVVIEGDFTLSVTGTVRGGAPPVDPPTTP
jgi:uncharacterized protein YjdB